MAVTKNPNAPSRTTEIIAVVTTETLIALFIVLLRLFVKLRVTIQKLWWDDWFIIAAIVLSLFHGAGDLTQMRFGLGHHIYDLRDDINVDKSVHIFYFVQISYFAVIGVIKMSILFFYMRLCQNSSSLRPAIHFMMVVITLTYTACVLAAIFQCTPIAYDWNKKIEGGKCFNRTAFYYANAGLNIVTDVIIYIMPMPTLWKVQISVKKRIGLVLVFAVGLFVVITSCLRIESLKTSNVTNDPTWENVGASLWSGTEFNVGIICACLPTLKPLFMKIANLITHGNTHGSTTDSSFGTSVPTNLQSEPVPLRNIVGDKSIHGGDIESLGGISATSNQSANWPLRENYEVKILGAGEPPGVSRMPDFEQQRLNESEEIPRILKTTELIITEGRNDEYPK